MHELESESPQVHSIPVGGDEPLHACGKSCWCFPVQDSVNPRLWVHNAKDCREAQERAGIEDPAKKWVLVRTAPITSNTEEATPTLRHDIEQAINRASAENESDTPDFVLTNYLMDCLAAYNRAVVARNAHNF